MQCRVDLNEACEVALWFTHRDIPIKDYFKKHNVYIFSYILKIVQLKGHATLSNGQIIARSMACE